VRPFVPERDKGHVLITSRESVFAELGIPRGLDIDELEPEDSVRFLLARTGQEAADDDGRAAAAELATELGNLPLALEQAAAYVAETGATFANYLSAYRKRRLSLLEKAGGLISRDTVAVTWAANFEAVELASPAAAEVLRVSTLLAPDAIPYELFLDGAQTLGGPIAEMLADPDDMTMSEVLRPLVRYSLVKIDASARVFSVHRLVLEITAGALTEARRQTYIEGVICALDASFPKVDYASWTRCERLVPHVASVARWVDDSVGPLETFGRVLDDAGEYLWRRGRYAEAQPLQERALAIREKALGPDHSDIAFSLNNLAILHYFQGRYAQAQPLQERALSIREMALGPGHPDVAHSLNNLANLHRRQGRYAHAQSLHERALAIREEALGPDHTDVASSLNNLAEIHSSQGRFAQAQPLHERALAIKEKALGPDHPSVASSLDNLAANYRHQGRHREAEPLHERALAILEMTLGPDHPEVAVSLTYLADAYVSRAGYAEAEPLYERALGVGERALGADHLDLFDALVGLAAVRKELGRIAEARSLYERALAIKERAYAADHPELEELRNAIDALREVP
jgi:tetratricopeptide (TPR) repeat protein